MKKLSILFSIFLIGLIPVVNINAQTTYQSLTFTTFDLSSPFAPYAASNSVDVNGWNSIGLYIDEDLANDLIFEDINEDTGTRWLYSRINTNTSTEIGLDTLYDTQISGLTVFKVPSGVTEISLIIGQDGLTESQLANKLANSEIFVFEVDNASNVNSEIAFQNGLDRGYQEALAQIEINQETIYNEGYAQGQLDSQSDTTAIATFIPQILSLGFGFFFQIFSIEVMGVSFLQWFAAIVGVAMSFVLFKAILK